MFFVIMEKADRSERCYNIHNEWSADCHQPDVLFFRTPAAGNEYATQMCGLSILSFYVVMVDPSGLAKVSI